MPELDILKLDLTLFELKFLRVVLFGDQRLRIQVMVQIFDVYVHFFELFHGEA